jgi:aminoglycoside 2'-N-acetyltransferase I
MSVQIYSVEDGRLTSGQHDGLRDLFDAEYREAYSPWDPSHPYGYSPATYRLVASDGEQIVGHVGIQPRMIEVGKRDVLVGGTGGVLVSPRHRGSGLGRRLVQAACAALSHAPLGVQFGYLGCRDEVVPFYESAGWQRVFTTERSLSRLNGSSQVSEGPLLVSAGLEPLEAWPHGQINLRGTPW